MPYQERTDEEIVKALEKWAENHHFSNFPCILLAGRLYTRREFVEMVKIGHLSAKEFIKNFKDKSRLRDADPVEVLEQAAIVNQKQNADADNDADERNS